MGECALNQSFWQLRGGKVGGNAPNMLSEEREMTRAKVAMTKKNSPDTAAFERKRLSVRKKVRESGFRRRDRERPWKRGDRGEMEERRKSVPFCRKVSAFVDADISKARTTKGDVS